MYQPLFEWGGITVNIDDINSIQYHRYVEEEYDYDDDDNPIAATLYDLTLYDSQDNILQYADNIMEDELEDELGETIANELRTAPSNKGYLQDFVNTVPADINNVTSVNAVAKKLWPVTEYIADARGYIMPDGQLLYFGPDIDHSSICNVTGMTVGKYESLGNIRCGADSFELELAPTTQQKAALRKLIANHKGDTLYVDIVKYDKGTYADNICSCMFHTHNPSAVLNRIDRYFNTSIKPEAYFDDEVIVESCTPRDVKKMLNS